MKTRTSLFGSGVFKTYNTEFCVGASFGHEPLETASSEDIEQHRKHGSGLCWIESAASVPLNGGMVERF